MIANNLSIGSSVTSLMPDSFMAIAANKADVMLPWDFNCWAVLAIE
jgi:hypothetical protein